MHNTGPLVFLFLYPSCSSCFNAPIPNSSSLEVLVTKKRSRTVGTKSACNFDDVTNYLLDSGKPVHRSQAAKNLSLGLSTNGIEDNMANPSAARLADYIDLLKRNKLYRSLCLSEGINFIGEWMTLVASIEVGKRLGGGGMVVSVIYTLRRLPSILLLPVTGVVADMQDRGKIFVATMLLDAVVVSLLPLSERLKKLWFFYFLVFVQFTIAAFLTPARQALAPMIVAQKDMRLQATLDSILWAAIGTIGASLGGFVVAILGTTSCFLLDSTTYIVGAFLSLCLIGLPFKPIDHSNLELPDSQVSKVDLLPKDYQGHSISANWQGSEAMFLKPSLKHSKVSLRILIRACHNCGLKFKEGLQYLLKDRNRHIATLAMTKGYGCLIWGVADILYVELADQESLQVLGGSSATLGIFYGFSCAGSVLGPLISNQITSTTPKSLMGWIGISFGLMALSYAVMSMEIDFYTILIITMMRSAGGEILWAYSTTLLQSEVDLEMMGRISALEDVFASLCGISCAVFIGFSRDVLNLTQHHVSLMAALCSAWFAHQFWKCSIQFEENFKGKKHSSM